MGSRARKKVKILPQEFGDGDRLSRLPDELLHKILSFVDAKEAVQTSILSRRWKPIWTTLPFLSFGRYLDSIPKNVCKFIRHVLSNRNHQSHISDLNLSGNSRWFSGHLLEKFVKYVISHNLQSLSLELLDDQKPYKLSTFSSKSLKKLKLTVSHKESAPESDCWHLPALTFLHLKHTHNYEGNILNSWLKDSWFTCLPALRTLCLDYWNLSESSFSSSLLALTTLHLSNCTLPFSFSLPALTTLHLSNCKLPTTVLDFPNLLSLQLDGDDLPHNMSDIFSALVNLKNLTLFLKSTIREYFISCPPQLLNLSITASFCQDSYICRKILVSAPKLCNFTTFGIFTATMAVPELENVNISLQGRFRYMRLTSRKQYYRQLTNMLPGLGNAKNLTFDLESIKALSDISNLLVSLHSPFYKLKYVKLPREVKESSISDALRSYLLGASSNATIVTKLPQKKLPQTVAVSMTDQNAALQESLTAPTKKLDDSQYIHQTPCVHTVNMNVQERHVVEDSVGDGHVVQESVAEADRVRHIEASVAEIDKDRVSSPTGNRGFGLWRGHEVNSEFVCLLDQIMHKYPETFEHCTTTNKNLCTINLNMLCTSLNDFTRISLIEVNSEMILEYMDVFAYLQNRGLNVDWAVNRLNYIKHLRFSKPLISELHAIDCLIDDERSKLKELQARVDVKIQLQDLQACVDDAKTKLQTVQALCMKKLAEIEDAFGTMGSAGHTDVLAVPGRF